jgi:signal transduction histidine kinase
VQLRVEILRQEAPALADAAHLGALARLAADAGKRLSRLRELASGGAASPPGHIALRDAVLEATDLARPHVERASAERRRPVLMQVTVPDLLPPPVVADPAELRHVLLNLVLNARDAMPEGGVIRVRAMHAGGWGIVTMSDEGTGFAPEHLHRAFEPFFTTKGERGSGLGLSGAAAFMRQVGGYIAVENRLDGGARVRLTFPAYRAPVEAVETSARAVAARGET